MVILILIDFQYFQNVFRILFSALKKVQVGQNHSLSVSRDSVKSPNKFFIPLSNVGESPNPLHYLKNTALFCCPLFSEEHFNPIRSTKWWTNNVDFQPKTFSIALNATTSHIFTDLLGLYISPKYLLHFLSNLYIPPRLGRNVRADGAQITGKWICTENNEL